MMRSSKATKIKDVCLPWSEGLLSAQLWQHGEKTVVGIPELGLHCWGASQPEAVFRLFTTLLKYYRQLKSCPERLGKKGLKHLSLLQIWVESIEQRITAKQPAIFLVKN